MASAQTKPDLGGLRAVAALELLAAAAPAGIVAADLVALADDPLLRRHSPAPRVQRARGRHGGSVAGQQGSRPGPRGSDRLRASQRLVLVGDRAAVDGLRRLRPLELVD